MCLCLALTLGVRPCDRLVPHATGDRLLLWVVHGYLLPRHTFHELLHLIVPYLLKKNSIDQPKFQAGAGDLLVQHVLAQGYSTLTL